MSQGFKNKAPHLSIVGSELREGSAQGTKILSESELTLELKTITNRYISMSGSSGVLIGALVGSSFWDIRPILFESGRVVIIRTSDPSFILDPLKFADFRSRVLGFFQWVRGTSGSLLEFGESGGQIWTKRIYFDRTLIDASLQTSSPINTAKVAIDLCLHVQKMHKAGIVHGHISLSNLGLLNDGIMLHDEGLRYCGFTPATKHFVSNAPELSSTSLPDFKSDIYGLGVCLKKIIAPSLLSGDLGRFIDICTSESPELRPGIDTIISVISELIPSQNSSHLNIPTLEQANYILTPPVNKTLDFGISLKNLGQNLRSKISVDFAFIAIISFVSLLFLSRWFFNTPDEEYINTNEFVSFWESGQPSLMIKVADAALNNDILAQQTIIQGAMNQLKLPKIQNSLIAIAFNPLWEAELNEEDRKIGIAIGVGGLKQEYLKNLSSFKNAHPGIIFAVAAEVDVHGRPPLMLDIKVEMLKDLPSPYGPLFSKLYRELKVKNMADPAALAFSHILARNLEEGIVRTFIGDDPKARLRFLAEDVLPSLPSLSDSLLEAISVDDRFRLNLNWFKSDKTAEWVKEGTPTKLLLLAETVPNAPLTKEKYIDLLTFPNKEIKNTAINIVHGLTKLNVEFLNFLASPTSKLNRSQLIFLITALSTPGKTGEVATSRWFKLTPDPGTVANFLNISPTKKSELFNVQVVSYLKDSRWAPTLDVLKQLILHREPLIRALAYTRFDLSHETHRDLIEKMSVIDPDPRLRKSLVDQLSIPQPEDEHFTSIRQ